jgi:hypothetical protein
MATEGFACFAVAMLAYAAGDQLSVGFELRKRTKDLPAG